MIERSRSGSRRQILYIEDNEGIREITLDFLSKKGFGVAGTSLGRGGLEWLKRQPPGPTLVLLDFHLPDMDGFQFLLEKRKLQPGSEIPIMVISARSFGIEEKKRFPEVVAFFEKPVDLRQLEAAIGSLG